MKIDFVQPDAPAGAEAAIAVLAFEGGAFSAPLRHWTRRSAAPSDALSRQDRFKGEHWARAGPHRASRR